LRNVDGDVLGDIIGIRRHDEGRLAPALVR